MVDLGGGGGIGFMRSLGALVGAECVERIRITGRWEFWLDEDAMAAGKVVNQAATRVARDFGAQFSLCGSVVITGVDDDADGWPGLSLDQVDAILLKVTGCRSVSG